MPYEEQKHLISLKNRRKERCFLVKSHKKSQQQQRNVESASKIGGECLTVFLLMHILCHIQSEYALCIKACCQSSFSSPNQGDAVAMQSEPVHQQREGMLFLPYLPEEGVYL